MSSRAYLVSFIALLALTAGCSASPAGLRIVDASVRAAPEGVPVSAAYLTIDNRAGEADRLLSVECPAAGEVQMHVTVEEEGVLRMLHRDDGLSIPAGATVVLEPGGAHLMLMQLTGPLETGSSIPLRLHLERAGTIDISAPVTGL